MKAIVMETRGKKAAILLKDGTFRTVNGRYSVGETIDYQEKARQSFKKWMAAAAAFALMLGIAGGLWYDAGYAAYAEVSLDVNPSIVYTVNKRAQVLKVCAVNSEALELVSALEEEGIRFMPVAEAIDRTMLLFQKEGYLDAESEDYVLVNVSADSADLQQRVTAQIEIGMGHAMGRDASMEYRVDHSDRATAKRAADSNVSIGRYAVWEREGGDRELEEYAEMPICEVMGKPAELNPARSEGGSAAPVDKGMPFDPAEGGQEQRPSTPSDAEPSEKTEIPDDPMSLDGSDARFGAAFPLQEIPSAPSLRQEEAKRSNCMRPERNGGSMQKIALEDARAE